MDQAPLASELYSALVKALGAGCHRVAVWGPDATGIELLALLARSNLLKVVTVLVDDEPSPASERTFGLPVVRHSDIATSAIDVIVITADADKERRLRLMNKLFDSSGTAAFPVVLFAGARHYEFNDPVFSTIVKSCAIKSKAGGYPSMLVHLYQALRSIALRGIKGDVTEFGVFQGGTTVFIAKVLAHFQHEGRVFGFDTFSGFPSRRSLLDLYRDQKCEFLDFSAVQRYCAPHNIELIRGDICETYQRIRELDLALSFFDTDNYSPTRAALSLCVERTVIGGFIAFDHFYSPQWLETVGERIAAVDLLDAPNWLNLHGTGIFTRLA